MGVSHAMWRQIVKGRHVDEIEHDEDRTKKGDNDDDRRKETDDNAVDDRR